MTTKTHPVSVDLEKSPSSMDVKQFENTSISINAELTKIFLVEVI